MPSPAQQTCCQDQGGGRNETPRMVWKRKARSKVPHVRKDRGEEEAEMMEVEVEVEVKVEVGKEGRVATRVQDGKITGSEYWDWMDDNSWQEAGVG